MAKKVFLSGSCRLLNNFTFVGIDELVPIHSMKASFIGINFLSKLHNTKEHIQFLEWIIGIKEIHPSICPYFFTHANENCFKKRKKTYRDNDKSIYEIRDEIRKDFKNCCAYIIEVCSLKIYTMNVNEKNYQVHKDLCNDSFSNDRVYMSDLQTEVQLYSDLLYIKSLLPSKSKIIFQCHFRPDYIYNDIKQSIPHRNIIHKTLNNFCKNNGTLLHDPSLLIENNKEILKDQLHFTDIGHKKNFEALLNLINNGQV